MRSSLIRWTEHAAHMVIKLLRIFTDHFASSSIFLCLCLSLSHPYSSFLMLLRPLFLRHSCHLCPCLPSLSARFLWFYFLFVAVGALRNCVCVCVGSDACKIACNGKKNPFKHFAIKLTSDVFVFNYCSSIVLYSHLSRIASSPTNFGCFFRHMIFFFAVVVLIVCVMSNEVIIFTTCQGWFSMG